MHRWLTCSVALALLAGCERNTPNDVDVDDDVDTTYRDDTTDTTPTDRTTDTTGTGDATRTTGDQTGTTGDRDTPVRPISIRTPGEGTDLSTQSQQFLKEAASGGKLEVELGRLAVQKAQNEQVKQFGQRMVDDHQKANDELMQIANDANVDIQDELSGHHRQMRDDLTNLSGEEFDREYIRMMVTDHRDVISKFEEQARDSNQDQKVRDFAQRTLPILRSHLQSAENIARDLGIEVPQQDSRRAATP